MRCAGARAAALLLALALGTAGCDLVSSLTPFGIGTKDYSTGVKNVNGSWSGKTATGGDVTFQVGSDTVIDLRFHHVAEGCTLSFESLTLAPPILDGKFTLDLPLEPQGRFVATGIFGSSTTCSGTYFFEGLPAGSCPTAGSGTFSASKTL
jgi:hypothetical protein